MWQCSLFSAELRDFNLLHNYSARVFSTIKCMGGGGGGVICAFCDNQDTAKPVEYKDF